jgi:hypothetical protein
MVRGETVIRGNVPNPKNFFMEFLDESGLFIGKNRFLQRKKIRSSFPPRDLFFSG